MNLVFQPLGQALAAKRSVLSAVFLLTTFAFLSATGATAHELRPALAELVFADDGSAYEITIQTNLEARIAEVGPDHEDTDDSPKAVQYDQLRSLSSEALNAAFSDFRPTFLDSISIKAGDTKLVPEIVGVEVPPLGDIALARDSFVTISGAIPAGADAITFGWDAGNGPIVIRTALDEAGEGFSSFLSNGDVSGPIAVAGAKTSALKAFIAYIGVGFEHIVPLGLDHILFVIGLFLLSTQVRPLLVQITAFTLAHTVTLALGILGFVSIPGSIVEPLIALSIVYVAIENILAEKLSPWRPAIVFMFGLLHGLGFAGVLSEFGLAPGQFAVSLIAFNIGVELGQLFVVAVCFAIFGYWFGGKDWYRLRIVYPASAAIGGYALAWFLERSLEIELSLLVVVLLTGVLTAALLQVVRRLSDVSAAVYVLVVSAALVVVLRVLEGMIP